MNNELARQLKEAGFPLRVNFGLEIKSTAPNGTEHDISCIKLWNIDATQYFEPTLEELIEACGERFLFLEHQRSHPLYLSGGWRAQEIGTDNGIAEGNGATPTEAVAKLWLALNKK